MNDVVSDLNKLKGLAKLSTHPPLDSERSANRLPLLNNETQKVPMDELSQGNSIPWIDRSDEEIAKLPGDISPTEWSTPDSSFPPSMRIIQIAFRTELRGAFQEKGRILFLSYQPSLNP